MEKDFSVLTIKHDNNPIFFKQLCIREGDYTVNCLKIYYVFFFKVGAAFLLIFDMVCNTVCSKYYVMCNR